MTESSGTIRLHRILRAPVNRVYRAFLEPDALCRWMPPYGFLGKIDRMDARVGGGLHMSFTNFENGHSHGFESTFVELVLGQRIRIADKFDDPAWAADMNKIITLRSVICGTELEILQTGLPAFIPLEMCQLGWQESLLQLAHLVEHEMPSASEMPT